MVDIIDISIKKEVRNVKSLVSVLFDSFFAKKSSI